MIMPATITGADLVPRQWRHHTMTAPEAEAAILGRHSHNKDGERLSFYRAGRFYEVVAGSSVGTGIRGPGPAPLFLPRFSAG